MKTNKQFLSHLNKIGACAEAIMWVKEHGGTASECWKDCVRGDWMAWLAAKDTKKLCITKRQLVGALADCAALSLKYYEAEYPKDKRVRDCINTCRRYANGKATDDELRQASYAAASASYAAYAAASASYAAASASYAASYAASAAYAAAYAASDARAKTLKQCANIFRKHFPNLL